MTIYTKSQNVSWGFRDGLVTIRDNNSEMFFDLNDVGSLIWDMVDGVSTLDDILRAILDEFDVDIGEAQSDLTSLIQELMDFELIVPITNEFNNSQERRGADEEDVC